MSEVKAKRLGDLITLKRGYDLPEKDRVLGDFPVISSAGISGYHNDYKVEGQGVVTGRYGTLGKMYFVDGKYWPHNTALYVQDFKGNDPRYIYYLLNCIGRIKTSDKSAVPGVNRNELHDMAVPAISDEDSQISARNLLWSIDKKIELNNKINAELEAMAKLIYDYWFVQFDFPSDAPENKGKPYKSSGGKMVYNEELKREIPEGWSVGVFGDYAKVKSGFAFKSSWWQPTGVPVVKIKDIQENNSLDQTSLSFVSEEKISATTRFISKANDVVIAMTGATIGKFAIIPLSDKPLLINQRVGLYDLGEDPISKLPFLINSMKQEFFRDMIFQLAGGAAQPNISNDQLDKLPLVLPGKDLIEKYNELMLSTYKKYSNNEYESQRMAELRDWLLPMLMNGQVTVKNTREK